MSLPYLDESAFAFMEGCSHAGAISVCWFSEIASRLKFTTAICFWNIVAWRQRRIESQRDGNLRGKEDHRDPILQEIPATSLILQSKFLPLWMRNPGTMWIHIGPVYIFFESRRFSKIKFGLKKWRDFHLRRWKLFSVWKSAMRGLDPTTATSEKVRSPVVVVGIPGNQRVQKCSRRACCNTNVLSSTKTWPWIGSDFNFHLQDLASLSNIVAPILCFSIKFGPLHAILWLTYEQTTSFSRSPGRWTHISLHWIRHSVIPCCDVGQPGQKACRTIGHV